MVELLHHKKKKKQTSKQKKKHRRKEERFQYFHATDVKMWPLLMGFRYMAAITYGLITNDCHSHCS